MLSPKYFYGIHKNAAFFLFYKENRHIVICWAQVQAQWKQAPSPVLTWAWTRGVPMGVIPKSTSVPATELLRGLSTKSLPQSGCLREADHSKAPRPAPSAVSQDSGPHCPGDCRHHKGLSKALPLFSARIYSLKWPWLPMLCNSLPPCVWPAQQFVSPLGLKKSLRATLLHSWIDCRRAESSASSPAGTLPHAGKLKFRHLRCLQHETQLPHSWDSQCLTNAQEISPFQTH